MCTACTRTTLFPRANCSPLHSLVSKPEGGKALAFLEYGRQIKVGTTLQKQGNVTYIEAAVPGCFGWAVATSLADEPPPSRGELAWAANPAGEMYGLAFSACS